MKIVFVLGKCFNIYDRRTLLNIRSLIGDRHEIEEIQPQKNLYKKLQEMKPDILYLMIGGREHKEIIEIFRGKGATTVSDTNGECDITINDEPEQVFPVLVEALENGKDLSTVNGITYKHKTGKAERWDVSNIKPPGGNAFPLTFTTRGCKGQCSFCNIRLTQGPLRFRDIAEMIEEVKSFSDIADFNHHFRFADPSFDSNTPERMKEIARAIIKDLPGHTFEANFRPDFHETADDELMNLLVQSGLTEVFIGVESGNEADLQLYNKGTTVSDAEKTIELFRRYDCFVKIGFIGFNPWSTIERLRDNLAFLERNRLGNFGYLTRILTVSPGLPIMQTVIDEGLLYEHSYDVGNKMVKALMMILNDIKNKLNAKALELYTDLSTNEAKRQKRLAIRRNDETDYAIAEKYEKLMQSVLMFESDLLAEWFRNILDMMDKGKPLTEIMAMSTKYLNDEKLKVTIKYFLSLEKAMKDELFNHITGREPDKT